MHTFYAHLWKDNIPARFWLPQPDFPSEMWDTAYKAAYPLLGLSDIQADFEDFLGLTLGEARFGADHWRLSLPKRIYYTLKPVLPRALTRTLRQLYSRPQKVDANLQWPVESRYVEFLWEIMAQLLRTVPDQSLLIKPLWPYGCRYAFVLTHDVESSVGQSFIPVVADLEESLGFRSSFNFVPEGYNVDRKLVNELRERGFEVGIHGLKHDGKLFSSQKKFEQCARQINRYLKDFDAVGFRAPLTIRNPEWMQLLDIEYDLSFFDTDPFEPIPGGTMSIWPFFLGRFVELPYTLVQDYTLTSILNENSPRIWEDKVGFIEKYHGMALLNSHPDYLKNPANLQIYSSFLSSMKARDGYWHDLPRKIALWWRHRSCMENQHEQEYSIVSLVNGELKIRPHPDFLCRHSKPLMNDDQWDAPNISR